MNVSGFFLRDTRYNFTGMVASQGASLLLYGWLAGHLTPDVFGLYNTILGAALLVQGLGGMGVEYSLAADLASGNARAYLFRRYRKQMLMLAFPALLLAIMAPGWLALVAVSRAIALAFSPYRQLLSGSGQFKKFQWVNMVGPMVRLLCLAAVVNLQLSWSWLGWGFIVSELAEGSLSLSLSRAVTKQLGAAKDSSYSVYLKKSLYQGFTQLCSLLLSRLDWMLMLAFLGSGMVAAYSFQYKAYELLCLPLTALAPVFFQRMHAAQTTYGIKRQNLVLLSAVSALGMIIMLGIWPMVAPLVSRHQLPAPGWPTSLCFALMLPMACINNYLWTVLFQQGRQAYIFRAFLWALAFNLMMNMLLMPVWKQEGAALAMLLSLTLHNLIYLRACPDEGNMILDHFFHTAWLGRIFNRSKRQPPDRATRISLHEPKPLTAAENKMVAPAGGAEGLPLALADLPGPAGAGETGH